MSTSTGRVRARRSPRGGGARPSRTRTVAVTGAASGIGRALTERLANSGAFAKVVAIDDHRGDVSGVTWRIANVRDPALAGRLGDVDVLVHLDMDLAFTTDDTERSAYNVRGAQTVLTAAAAERVGHVVLVTSAMVYGAHPDNPVPLPEVAPILGESDSGIVSDFIEIERLAERAPRVHPGMEVTVLRPAALVGPGLDTVVTRHFESPRLLSVTECAPRWQFCHVDDLVSALEMAARLRVHGTLAVGSPGWLDRQQVEQITGRRSMELSARLTFGTAQRLHRLGVTPIPASDVHYVVYPWAVEPATLVAAGWRAEHDNESALGLLMEEVAGRHAALGRRLPSKLPSKETTLTAAGATVAVIGTAAIVRHARKRRK